MSFPFILSTLAYALYSYTTRELSPPPHSNSPPSQLPSLSDPISPFKKYYNSLPPNLQTTYTSQIGDTPLLELKHLSHLLTLYARSLSPPSSSPRRRSLLLKVYAKLEYRNPGGTGKDRLALSLVAGAQSHASLSGRRLAHIVEGSSGSTGISLAAVCYSARPPPGSCGGGAQRASRARSSCRTTRARRRGP